MSYYKFLHYGTLLNIFPIWFRFRFRTFSGPELFRLGFFRWNLIACSWLDCVSGWATWEFTWELTRKSYFITFLRTSLLTSLFYTFNYGSYFFIKEIRLIIQINQCVVKIFSLYFSFRIWRKQSHLLIMLIANDS